jgi:hypothetical protein
LIEVQVLRDKPIVLESLDGRIAKTHRIPTARILALRSPESAVMRVAERSLRNYNVAGRSPIVRGDLALR